MDQTDIENNVERVGVLYCIEPSNKWGVDEDTQTLSDNLSVVLATGPPSNVISCAAASNVSVFIRKPVGT